jgi:leader peptidase (prepilin peptidase)/N-methyltransferase
MPEGTEVYKQRMFAQTGIACATYTLIGFLFGACVGSFADAAAARTVAEEKWWGASRSRCDACGRTLSAFDLFPVVSYLYLKGRCRTCGAKIPPRHLYTELLSGALGALFVWRFGVSVARLFSFAALLFLLFHSLTDLESGYIYDAWAIAMAAVSLALRLALGGFGGAFDGLLGGALGFGVIYLIVLLSRGGIGSGYAMLMLGAGALLGWKFTALSLYLGFMAGGVVVIPLLLLKKVSRKDSVPLGPFLSAGAFLCLLFGNAVFEKLGFLPNWPWN